MKHSEQLQQVYNAGIGICEGERKPVYLVDHSVVPTAYINEMAKALSLLPAMIEAAKVQEDTQIDEAADVDCGILIRNPHLGVPIAPDDVLVNIYELRAYCKAAQGLKAADAKGK